MPILVFICDRNRFFTYFCIIKTHLSIVFWFKYTTEIFYKFHFLKVGPNLKFFEKWVKIFPNFQKMKFVKISVVYLNKKQYSNGFFMIQK